MRTSTKKNLKVAVIGSAPYNTRNKPMGQYIDSCDVVVRFNRYTTLGHEKYVGSKTTIWCYFAERWRWKKGPPLIGEDVKLIWIVRREHPKMFSWVEKDAEQRQIPLWDIPRRRIVDLMDRLNGSFPSTGIVGLYAAMRLYDPPIYTQGLGMFRPNKRLHYYEDKSVYHLRNGHDIVKESNLISKWRERGGIIPSATPLTNVPLL
jgi:hypothetical protein